MCVCVCVCVRVHQKLSSFMTDKFLTLNDVQYASFVVHVSTGMQSTSKYSSQTILLR